MSINTEFWINEIVEYARLVLDDTLITDAWISNRRDKTSIFYPGEFIEQVLGGLDSVNMLEKLSSKDGIPASLINAIQEFIGFIVELSRSTSEEYTLIETKKVLSSREWQKVRKCASLVIQADEQFRGHGT